MLAGCSPGGDQASGGLTDAQIEALSLDKAKQVPNSLLPDMLGLGELEPEDRNDPALRGGCILSIANQPLLLAGRYQGVVRRNGRVKRLQVNGPIGSTGAFLENEELSISIGQPRDGAGAAPRPGIARARINDRRNGNSTEVEANWSCGG